MQQDKVYANKHRKQVHDVIWESSQTLHQQLRDRGYNATQEQQAEIMGDVKKSCKTEMAKQLTEILHENPTFKAIYSEVNIIYNAEQAKFMPADMPQTTEPESRTVPLKVQLLPVLPWHQAFSDYVQQQNEFYETDPSHLIWQNLFENSRINTIFLKTLSPLRIIQKLEDYRETS